MRSGEFTGSAFGPGFADRSSMRPLRAGRGGQPCRPDFPGDPREDGSPALVTVAGSGTWRMIQTDYARRFFTDKLDAPGGDRLTASFTTLGAEFRLSALVLLPSFHHVYKL